MARIDTTADPNELGFDAARLRRIDEHFAGYVTAGKLPGFAVLVSRAGKVGHFTTYGYHDIARELPIEAGTVYRIYSMTKPVTSVAAMMLYEEGRVDLNDPVSKYSPSLPPRISSLGGSSLKPVLRPASGPVRLWHLLSHTSGMTYGVSYSHAVDAIYRANGFETGALEGWTDLAACCDALARLPLMFEPGRAGTTPTAPTSWAAWWRSSPAKPSTSSLTSASSDRSG
jgi:CubicO group peptidase (beta-lactamase class C family)